MIVLFQSESPPIRMVPPGVTFLHTAEQFVFIVLEFQEYYKEKCMSPRGTVKALHRITLKATISV